MSESNKQGRLCLLGKGKSHTKEARSKSEQDYDRFFKYESPSLGTDPFKQVSLYDYSIPVTTGASTATTRT